ncbi:MoxR family ATPase, partial [Microbacteriaceae bacterium K1510]|nr:MoxR family ATPase [Microbacteriaceae bacterium K1510]
MEPVISVEEIAQIQRDVQLIHVSDAVEDFVIDLTEATRQHKSVEVGISPRAMLLLVRSAQAIAYIEGRNYVLPDDVKQVVPALFTHRLQLTMEAELHVTENEVVEEILHTVPAPVEEGV